MDVFAAFSLLLAAGFIVAGFFRPRIVDPAAFRRAIGLLVAALILYYPISAIFYVGVYLSFVARPLGFVLGVISFRVFCLALIAPGDSGKGS